MSLDELRPGDLVFLPPRKGDPTGEFVVELDGRLPGVKYGFSHVGIVVSQDLMLNSRPRRLSDMAADEPDFGGVQVTRFLDPLRPAWVGHPRPEADPAAAIERARSFEEAALQPRVHRSGFSLTKLFLVAVALHATRSEQPDLGDLAERAARAWSVQQQLQLGQEPTFYCAELVAQAFDLDFPRSELRPPPSTQVPDALIGDDEPFEWFRLYRTIRTAVRHELDHTEEQWDTLVDVVRYIATRDLGFAKRCLKFLHDLGREMANKPEPPPRAAPEDDALTQGADDATWLPRSLVTPRMLADTSSATGLLEWLRPLEPTVS